jgi:hypothetical protein
MLTFYVLHMRNSPNGDTSQEAHAIGPTFARILDRMSFETKAADGGRSPAAGPDRSATPLTSPGPSASAERGPVQFNLEIRFEP